MQAAAAASFPLGCAVPTTLVQINNPLHVVRDVRRKMSPSVLLLSVDRLMELLRTRYQIDIDYDWQMKMKIQMYTTVV
jgi:hypothetical protein